MNSLTLESPAKLNIYLKVLNKREDGYHNLETIFERINLVDHLTFSTNSNEAIRIFCDHPDVPLDSKNLVFQVAQILKNDFALQNGVDIKIDKRIPVAAGLAGGSSNAATTLLGLNRLWKLDLKKEELIDYGRRIGSDVPFFLHDCSWGLGTGRGDQISELPIKTQIWHWLIVPSIKMHSKEVFGALNLELTKPNDDVNILTRSLKDNDLSTLGNFLKNDLEPTIIKLCPNLSKLKERLRGLNPKGVAFSGSGPALYGITDSKEEAEKIKDLLQQDFTQVFVVRTH